MTIPPTVHSEWSKAHAETWRVVLVTGEIREVLVTPDDCHDPACETCEGDPARLGWVGKAGDEEVYGVGGTRLCAMYAAWAADWPVREIVAPGELTQREQCAALCERQADVERKASADAEKHCTVEADIHDNREAVLLEVAVKILRGDQ